MQKENNVNDVGALGTLTGIIYCPKSNHYVYIINGDPVAIYDDQLIVNTSKCNTDANENDELRTDVLRELLTILLHSSNNLTTNLQKDKQ